MARKKLIRFKEITVRDNILTAEYPFNTEIKGNWNASFFKNNNPVVLELGCGRGEYTIGLAERFPGKNFIGIDVKGDRIWKGSTAAIENNLNNVGFLRAQIQHLDHFFDENEVQEIWITFPDPRPKVRDTKRRLTSPRFLKMYEKIIAPNGIVHLKTDNTALFDYTLETLQDFPVTLLAHTTDLYKSPLNHEHFGIKTKFEKSFYDQGFSIKYLKFLFGSLDHNGNRASALKQKREG